LIVQIKDLGNGQKSVLGRTQEAMVNADKAGAEGVKDVASDALGAAAFVATGIILDRVAEALGGGQPNPEKARFPVRTASTKTARSRPNRQVPNKKRNTTEAFSATRTAIKTRSATKARKATKRAAMKKEARTKQ
jgi:hypothetical protein